MHQHDRSSDCPVSSILRPPSLRRSHAEPWGSNTDHTSAGRWRLPGYQATRPSHSRWRPAP